MAKKGSKTTFKSSETVVSSEYLNKLYGGLKGTSQEQFYDSTDPFVGGHVHDGQHIDGHAQKINLSEHVTGKLPLEYLDGTVETSPTNPGLPNKSFQFNSSDTFAGSETFIFNNSDRSIQLSKDTYFWLGSIDSPNSFYIEHEVEDYIPILEFYAINSSNSKFVFTNGTETPVASEPDYGGEPTSPTTSETPVASEPDYGGEPTSPPISETPIIETPSFGEGSSPVPLSSHVVLQLVSQTSFFYPEVYSTDNSSYLGKVIDDDNLFPWMHTNTKELKLWKIDSGSFATSRSVTFKLDNSHSESYTLTMPEYRPSTADVLKVSSHDGGGNVNLEWASDEDSTLTIAAPNRSFQFNSSDTLGGSETFIFNESDRSIQLSKDTYFWLGSIDSSNSFYIEHEVDGTTPILEFYAVNSVDSEFVFTNGVASGSSSLTAKLENQDLYLYPSNSSSTNTGYLGRVFNDDNLNPWLHTNTKELKLWKIDSGSFATSRSVTFKLDNAHSESYTLTMPEYRPSTSDALVVVNHDGFGNVTLTWDTLSSSASVGIIDNIQVSDGYGGFQSTDWVILSDNTLKPFSGHHNIGAVGSEVGNLYVLKDNLGEPFNGIIFSDSSDVTGADSSYISVSDIGMSISINGSANLDGEAINSLFVGGFNNSNGTNTALFIGLGSDTFGFKTNRQTFDTQILELPQSIGSAGQTLVIDSVSNNVMRTSWQPLVASGLSSKTSAYINTVQDPSAYVSNPELYKNSYVGVLGAFGVVNTVDSCNFMHFHLDEATYPLTNGNTHKERSFFLEEPPNYVGSQITVDFYIYNPAINFLDPNFNKILVENASATTRVNVKNLWPGKTIRARVTMPAASNYISVNSTLDIFNHSTKSFVPTYISNVDVSVEGIGMGTGDTAPFHLGWRDSYCFEISLEMTTPNPTLRFEVIYDYLYDDTKAKEIEYVPPIADLSALET